MTRCRPGSIALLRESPFASRSAAVGRPCVPAMAATVSPGSTVWWRTGGAGASVGASAEGRTRRIDPASSGERQLSPLNASSDAVETP